MTTLTEDLTPEELAELKRLEAAATPGPWKVFTATDGHKVIGIGEMTGDGVTDCGFGIWRNGDPEHLANAQIIAAARNTLPRLIAMVEDLRSQAALDGGAVSRQDQIEAVARAICNAAWKEGLDVAEIDCRWHLYRSEAIAAIAALRTPPQQQDEKRLKPACSHCGGRGYTNGTACRVPIRIPCSQCGGNPVIQESGPQQQDEARNLALRFGEWLMEGKMFSSKDHVEMLFVDFLAAEKEKSE